MGDSVTVGFGCGFAFATGFPVTLCLTLSREMVSDVSVTYLSFHSQSESKKLFCLEKKGFDHDFDTVTFLMKADLHIQDRADFRVSQNPPSHSGCFFASR